MKIARIDSHSIKVPYTFGGGHQGEGLRTWTTNNILLVRVETDTGIVGWGEAFCYACTDAVRAALHSMVAPLAIGQDARDIARLSYDLQQKLHLFGRYGITIFALSGLDIALWDIAGKAANLPLHRLLGGAGRDSLPAYASLLKYRDPEKVAARAKQAFDEGAIATSSCTRPRRPRCGRPAGGGRGRGHHGRHQLPVDARAGAPHDDEAPALRSPLARGADLPARGFSAIARLRARHGCADGGGREQLHSPSSSATCSPPAPSTTHSPALTKVGGVTEFLKVATLAACCRRR